MKKKIHYITQYIDGASETSETKEITGPLIQRDVYVYKFAYITCT